MFIQHLSKFTVMFYSLTAMCSAFHRYCNTPMSQCVVHFMCSGALKCLIQHSSEPVHCNVLFKNCYE